MIRMTRDELIERLKIAKKTGIVFWICSNMMFMISIFSILAGFYNTSWDFLFIGGMALIFVFPTSLGAVMYACHINSLKTQIRIEDIFEKRKR